MGVSMIINRETFLKFLQAVELENTYAPKDKTICDVRIKEIILNFSNIGLEITVDIPFGAGQIYACINKEAFDNYTPIGKVGIDDLENLVNLVSRLRSTMIDIEINVSTSCMIIRADTKQAVVELVNPTYIDVPTYFDVPQYESSFSFPITEVRKLLIDLRENNTEIIRVSSKYGEVSISSIGRNVLDNLIKSETVKIQTPSNFNNVVPIILTHLFPQNEIKLSFGRNLPMYIICLNESKTIKIEYLINQVKYMDSEIRQEKEDED
jgi:hypothetical protein